MIHAARHMKHNNLMGSSQKGFMHGVSGCVEQQYTLQEAIFKAKSTGRSDVVLVMTDISNAFGSVRHKLIEFALRHYRFSEDFIQLMRSIYEELQVKIQIGKESCTVSQNIGVFQGDPLSPILFNIVLNLILEPLSNKDVVKEHGITLSGTTRITNCAFADDVNLLARNVSSAQELLYIFEKALSWTRCLKAAPSKFA